MKKLILGMMLLAGIAAHGATNSTPTGAEVTSAAINMTAHSIGALTVTKGNDVDFGNLRAYNGEILESFVTVQDENLAPGNSSTVNFNVVEEEVVLVQIVTTGTGYPVPVTIAMAATNTITGPAAKTHDINISLDTAAANAAPAGSYAGSFTVRAQVQM